MTKRALLIIDVQNDYFEGGKWPLPGQAEAAENVKRLLESARAAGETVVHVQHVFKGEGGPFFVEGSEGAEINEIAKPLAGEPVVEKQQANAYLGTNLKEVLDAAGVEELTIAGSMTQNCIDAAARASADMGYKVTVVPDACAAMPLEFGGEAIPAKYVHGAFMAALGFGYAAVVSTSDYLAA